MTKETFTSNIFSLLLTIAVLLCVLTCNIFFTMFRTYQASLPFPNPQQLIINILFSQLSILWQASNIMCASVIVLDVILQVDIPFLDCALYYSRVLQIIATGLCIVFISFARFFANFWTDTYFNLPHQNIGMLCMWITILISFLSTLIVALLCNGESVCPDDKMCMDKGTQSLVFICCIIVFFLIGAIIIDYLQENYSCRQLLINLKRIFRCSFKNTIFPTTMSTEVPTISLTVDAAFSPPLTTNNPSPHNVTFSTGLITLIIAGVGAGLTIKVTNILGFSFYDSHIGPVYSVVLTTFISVYWVMANTELREFIRRVFATVVQSRYQNS